MRNPMKDLLIKTLSIRVLIAITFTLVGYAGVLGYVASETERDVQFWPPKIGSVPQAVTVPYMGGLEADLLAIKTILNDELVSLNSRLANARDKMAEESSVGGQDSFAWRQNVRSYEKEHDRIKNEILSRIRKVSRNLDSVKKSCNDLR
jgi:hypothetical protein